MQGVNVLGVSNPMQFPDDMDITDIRDFLRKKFTKQMVEGTQPVELGDRPQMMQAYEPTLQEKTANAIGEGLHSSGIISDRFGAQRIGENVSNIAAFTPAGAAFGGDEFGRATKKGDKLGMALGALEGVGIGGDIAKLAIFGGVLAKSADLKALAKAKKLETSGANRDEIWKETGWANDNGDWKFEISDYLDFDNEKGADINPSSFQIIKDFGGTTQENFMGHPELYDAYPNLRDRPIRSITGSGGQYNTGTDVVSIGDKLLSPTSGGELSNTQSVNLHELQHAIQQREKFAGGGSPDMFKGDKTIYDLKESQRKEFEDAYGYSQKFDYEILKKEPELYRELIKQGEQQGFSSRPFYDEFAKRNLPESDRVWFGKRMDSMDRELNSLRGNANKDPYEQYQRLAGEAEARNVQTRMDWTPEQRRATPPWKSLDVPEDELIYRKGGGIAQSTPSSAEMLGGVELGDAAKGTNQYGDDVFNISITKEGKKAGDIQYIDDGKAITILRSDVEDAGKGTGTAAYEQLIYRALLEGKTIKSDAIVSPSAAKVYEKLKDKGYKVEKATELFNVRRGETTTNRESRMAQSASAPTMTDDYGNRISKPYRIKGEPVYTIKP